MRPYKKLSKTVANHKNNQYLCGIAFCTPLKLYIMKILKFVSLLGCGLLWSCQSQEPVAPTTDDVADIKAEETAIRQISEDVNSAEVDNILGSLFGKEKKGRSADYDVHVIKDDKGNDRIICVNFADNKGYALVSAVKSYEPVLAYAETGHFSPGDELPPPVKAWMENTIIDIDESQTLPTDSLAKIASKWRRYESNKSTIKSRADEVDPDHSKFYNLTPEELQRLFHIMKPYLDSWAANDYRVYSIDDYTEPIEIGDKFALAGYVQGRICPIYFDDYWAITIVKVKEAGIRSGAGHWMKTTWNQLFGFNQSFPLIPNSFDNIPVGCGPVALGQVMYAYRYPNTFEWDLMSIDSYGNKYNSDFLLDIYKKTGARYNGEGTETVHSSRAKALREYGYTFTELSGEKVTTWNLAYNCPATVGCRLTEMVNNKTKTTGHVFLVEGSETIQSYREIEIWTFTYPDTFSCIYHEEADPSTTYRFYINWGYPRAENNGYYVLNGLWPSHENQIVSPAVIEDAIVNIRPNK